MKKLTAILLSLALLAALAACSQNNADQDAGDLLQRIQDKGELTIATEGTWAPWTFHDENDQLTGFDVEVARLVAEKLGVAATFVEGDFDGLLAGLESGRYDIMANGVEANEERGEKFSLSSPYAYIRTAIMVRGDNEDIKSFEDLAGKHTANTITSTYAKLAQSYGAEATGVDDLSQTIELLLAGRVDATLNAEVTYYDYIAQHPGANIKIAALTEDASLVVFPLPKGEDSATLLAAVNQAVEELMADGSIAELSVRFFGSDLTQGG